MTIDLVKEILNKAAKDMWPDLELDFKSDMHQMMILVDYLILNYRGDIVIAIDYKEIVNLGGNYDKVKRLLAKRARSALVKLREKVNGYIEIAEMEII